MIKTNLPSLGDNLTSARKKFFPGDTQTEFALRIGVSKGTYVKMERGELSVSLDKYYRAAELMGLESTFGTLFTFESSLLDD